MSRGFITYLKLESITAIMQISGGANGSIYYLKVPAQYMKWYNITGGKQW